MSARPIPARTPAIPFSYSLVRRRSLRSKIGAIATCLALIAISQQISCAGGGAGGSAVNSNFNPVPTASVSISPPSAQISAGASGTFTVTVQNAANPAVTWQVNGIAGGNSLVGTITPAGAGTASYNAPASVSTAITVTVAAVLQADATKFGSAMVTVNPLPGAQITVSPPNASVVQGASLQFTAAVQNGPQAVIWEVNNLPGGSTKFGTITSSPSGSLVAVYNAPAQIPSTAVVSITAVLETDLSTSGSTSLTIVPPQVSMSISPTTANVVTGQTQQFSATVQNSTAGITWDVNGLAGGNSILGTISSSGSYVAPFTVPNPATVTVTAVLQSNPPVSASSGVTVVLPSQLTGVYSWKNYNGTDNSLTGQNAQEIVLRPATVGSTASPTFGKLFSCPANGPIDGQIFAQPLYVANVAVGGVPHNVVYVATEHDSVYAFDADANPCQTLWQVSFIDPAMNVTTVPASDIPETDIAPEIGITGTPVIDPATATLYVVSKTKTIVSGSPVYTQQLHALDLATGWVGGVAGTEKFRGPATIDATVIGSGGGTLAGNISFGSLSLTENQRSALLLAGGNVYIAFDSYADSDPFHGWLFSYNAANLQSPPTLFITTPNGSRGGIGESGASPSSDVPPLSAVTGNVFIATSDGNPLDPSSGGDYPQTLVKLQANTTGGLQVGAAFTPSNEVSLEAQLKSFGTTGVLLLPNSLGAVPLAITGSEAVNGVASSPDLYVLNSGNLGLVQALCLPANGASNAPASIFGTPAYWMGNNTIYVVAANDSLKAFPVVSGTFSSPSCPVAAVPVSQSTDTFDTFAGSFGASPVISWDGSNASSGVVWALDTSGYTGSASTSSPAILHAYDAANLANKLYVSPSSGSSAAGLAVKFAVPTVANGKVFVGTQTELSVFGLQ